MVRLATEELESNYSFGFFSQPFDVKRLSRMATMGGERANRQPAATCRRIWSQINKQSDGFQQPKNNLWRINGAAATQQVAQGERQFPVCSSAPAVESGGSRLSLTPKENDSILLSSLPPSERGREKNSRNIISNINN